MMDIKKGQRKTFDVEYVEVTAENISELAVWCHGAVAGEPDNRYIQMHDRNAINPRQTRGYIGDFIVRHLGTNSFKAFPRRSFFKTIEPKPVAEVPESAPVVDVKDQGTGGDMTKVAYVPSAMSLEESLVSYSEWLDMEGIVRNGPDKRSHTQLVDDFLKFKNGDPQKANLAVLPMDADLS